MTDPPKTKSRADRLAAALRDNLKRRKAQARAIGSPARVEEERTAGAGEGRAPEQPKHPKKR